MHRYVCELEPAHCWLTVRPGPQLAAYGIDSPSSNLPAECMLVVDSGFSHTTVTPLIDKRPVQSAMRRLDLGGKHLTNHLIELLGVRELDLKDDPWIANELKELCCFVSTDFRTDMERTWRNHVMDPSIAVDCQLPNYEDIFKVERRPYTTKDAHANSKGLISLGNERFQVPELLFKPGDIGMAEDGLPQLIVKCINQLPAGLHPAMFSNIVVTGGNTQMSGFVERLYVLLDLSN